jgi:prepilin-type N-terminal cleavage/methylation domain-containing protein
MRTDRGFTLVELVVVISIITILTTIATLNWNKMVMKGAVEGQIKTVHADMMSVRLEALYGKRSRSVVVSGTSFSIYSSGVTTVSPVSSKTFKYKFSPAAATVTFDSSGMTNDQVTICVNAYNEVTLFETTDAYVDSLVISQARLNLAKRPEGGACNANGVTQR